MIISNVYSHKDGNSLLIRKSCHIDLQKAIESCFLKFQKGAPSGIKEHVEEYLTDLQWVDKVRVGTSKLTINFLKDKVGVSFQIGNVARTYADILKLNHLGNIGLIEVGVIMVPHEYESRCLGTNYASFERLSNEVELFSGELITPLVIYGISN